MGPIVIMRESYKRLCLLLPLKIKFYREFVAQGFRGKTILTFPHKPHPYTMLYKICHLLGYRMTRNLKINSSLIVNWEDTTFRRNYDALNEIEARQAVVVNIKCTDISKRRVDEVHDEVFGYRLSVDPRQYHGQCVKKSNRNAAHDGIIIECPVAEIDQESVYQIIVNNQINENYIEDIRVPVFKNTIPFCYKKHRLVESRFSNENAYVKIVETEFVFSEMEVELLLRFSEKIGLDLGELDVLRDVETRRLYVVDVNNTPFGPPNHLDAADAQTALKRLSEAFRVSFLT